MLENYEKEHISVLRSVVPECMVLLKSDESFPLEKPEKIALYGNGARKTIKGGTGSGDVNVRSFVTIEQGLENAGFEITSKNWLDGYDVIWQKAHKKEVGAKRKILLRYGLNGIIKIMGRIMQEPEYNLPIDAPGDTAVYVLSRVSGEGGDRHDCKGDFRLTNTEINNILTLEEKYKKFLLVLNVGGVIDLSPVVDKVSNILNISQIGMTIGDSFADVLLGKSFPSGKLTSTWAKYDDYCKDGDFGLMDDTRYNEGIYVGYRYFDTVGKKPLFPFGYGLGYTTFEIDNHSFETNGSHICVSADVINTGTYSGKETVQLYVSVPSGKLCQPYQTLAAFKKTEVLEPRCKQKISLEFDMAELSSFDEESACKILEKGDYILRLGNSSDNTEIIGHVVLIENVVVNQLSHVGGKADFSDSTYDAKFEVPEDINTIKISAEAFAPAAIPTIKYDERALELVKELSDDELIMLCVGAYDTGGSDSIIGKAGISVAGAAGETYRGLIDKGIKPLTMADGPAGLRLSPVCGRDEQGVFSIDMGNIDNMLEVVPKPLLKIVKKKFHGEREGKTFYQYCSAIPVGTALAQSWNTDVCGTCGDIVGEEMERFGVNLWLAPALNIHRNPLCGRNFEYYSEDPLISGKIAAAITRGVQSHKGTGVVLKHFACNNQETDRFNTNSILNERPLRDIYLRGFEIAVKEAHPIAIMSSYNLVNGEHTSQRSDLLETVLRGEWGFDGLVISDWVTASSNPDEGHRHPGAYAAGSIKAGNDIMMPGGKFDHDNLMDALNGKNDKYPITRENLEICAVRVLNTVFRLTD